LRVWRGVASTERRLAEFLLIVFTRCPRANEQIWMTLTQNEAVMASYDQPEAFYDAVGLFYDDVAPSRKKNVSKPVLNLERLTKPSCDEV
jgi:hypothetical protein